MQEGGHTFLFDLHHVGSTHCLCLPVWSEPKQLKPACAAAEVYLHQLLALDARSFLTAQTSWTQLEDTLPFNKHMAGIAAYCQLPGNVNLDRR